VSETWILPRPAFFLECYLFASGVDLNVRGSEVLVLPTLSVKAIRLSLAHPADNQLCQCCGDFVFDDMSEL
jgi:hypothetical protein